MDLFSPVLISKRGPEDKHLEAYRVVLLYRIRFAISSFAKAVHSAFTTSAGHILQKVGSHEHVMATVLSRTHRDYKLLALAGVFHGNAVHRLA